MKHGEKWYAIDAILWPVLNGVRTSFESSLFVHKETNEESVMQLVAEEGHVGFVNREGTGLTVKGELHSLPKLRNLHRLRVAAEREQDWYTTWLADRVWEASSKISAKSKGVLMKGRTDPIDDTASGGDVAIVTLSQLAQMMQDSSSEDNDDSFNGEFVVGDIVSVRENGEWAVSGDSRAPYGVCAAMRSRTDEWFVRECWATMPDTFRAGLRDEIQRHLITLTGIYDVCMQEKRRNDELSLIATFDPTMDVGGHLVYAAEKMRTATLVYQMAVRVTNDLKRSFKDHLSAEGVDATLMMDPTRSDFFSNFYTMVAFEVTTPYSLGSHRCRSCTTAG
jgi:hypothetical protein